MRDERFNLHGPETQIGQRIIAFGDEEQNARDDFIGDSDAIRGFRWENLAPDEARGFCLIARLG